MIKTEKGDLEVHGTDTEVMADISVIIKYVYKELSNEFGEEHAKKRLKRAFDRAFLTDEEIHKEAEARKEFSNIFDEIIKMIKGSGKND